MATRVKTVQYAFPMFTGIIADATVTNLTQTTVYIPETVASFISVTAEVGFQDIVTATGGTVGENRVGLRLGAGAYTTVTDLFDIANTGENIAGVLGPYDFTAVFTSLWTGTSMTADTQLYFDQNTGTTLGMRNVTVVLNITYTYDDTAATQLKTVAVPLESLLGPLTTTANSNIGTSQVPQMTGGGILPEAGVTVRDYHFIIEGNESNVGVATDFTISANIDSGTATAFGIQEAALATDRFARWIYKPAAVPTLTTTHNFQLWATTARLNHVAVTLYVTYEFTLSGTTRVLNSIRLPYDLGSPLGTSSAMASRFSREVIIKEPGTLTLRQSGFRINYNSGVVPSSYNFRAGSQAYRVYTPAASITAGMFSLQQRIDSGSSQGAAFTLARGKNSLIIDGYANGISSAGMHSNITGYIQLNYESDLASQGIGAHSHTVKKNIKSFVLSGNTYERITGITPTIPETNYYLLSAGYELIYQGGLAAQSIGFSMECVVSEAKGGGYYDIYTDAMQTDGETGTTMIWSEGLGVTRRYLNDPGANRVNIKSSRDYRTFTSGISSIGVASLYTYHSMPTTVTGNITGSAGGTVNISVYRYDTKELLYSTTRVGNGSYTFEWYDDTMSIYAEAYESSTRYGRSINVVPGVTNPDVALSTGSSVQVVARAYS